MAAGWRRAWVGASPAEAVGGHHIGDIPTVSRGALVQIAQKLIRHSAIQSRFREKAWLLVVRTEQFLHFGLKLGIAVASPMGECDGGVARVLAGERR